MHPLVLLLPFGAATKITKGLLCLLHSFSHTHTHTHTHKSLLPGLIHQAFTRRLFFWAVEALRAPEVRTVMNRVSGTIRTVSPEVTWSSKDRKRESRKDKNDLNFPNTKKKS